MCGILGFENSVSKRDVQSCLSLLKHRGPDGTGSFRDDYFTFIHWRLSIIDISPQASQPFYFKNWVLIFNGEIYNFREVAKILEGKGYQFTTQSDTEVLIKAFDCWREKAVNYFIGMFAFAIYDQDSRAVYLFRDRMGVKPLYYSLQGGLSFGSEAKVFRALGISLSIDPISVHQYFRFGYTPGERTIFKEVRKLLPGQFLKYSNGVTSLETYWSLPVGNIPDHRGEHDAVELESLLISAFNYRMVSDVPVGIFLSGGIDSSLVATLLQHHSGQRIKTFTIGFDHPDFDETMYAQQVANRLGAEHTSFKLGMYEARELFNNFYEIYDEPFADTSGIPTALVAGLAKQHGAKVVLSADGADELFGGYPHYQRIERLIRLRSVLPLSLRKILADVITALPSGLIQRIVPLNTEHRLATLAEYLDSSTDRMIYETGISNQADVEINQLTGNSIHPAQLLNFPSASVPQEDMMYWDLKYFLPDDLLCKVDRATMHHGTEGREPFLDHRVVEFARNLPMSQKISGQSRKHILKKILFKYHPASLFDRPKKGFSIPIFAWFSAELDAMFQTYLNPDNLRDIHVLQADVVQREYRKYLYYKKSGKQYNIEKMWRILSFAMWWEKYMKV